jgi:hypothetical protein
MVVLRGAASGKDTIGVVAKTGVTGVDVGHCGAVVCNLFLSRRRSIELFCQKTVLCYVMLLPVRPCSL